MKRLVTGCVALVVVACAAIPAAAAPGRKVKGTMTGPGGYDFSCGILNEFGSGTFRASSLGRGTYSFSICIEAIYPNIILDGTITLVTNGGATLTGTISDSVPLPISEIPPFDITITGGTGRFRAATGALAMGPLTQTDPTSCDPRIGLCFRWIDTGPLTGTVTRGAT